MRERGYSTHCVCVCVCVCLSDTSLACASRALRPQVRYQPKALDARNKTNVGISLSTLSSKVMTDFGSLTTVKLALTPQIRYLQGAGAHVKTRLVGQALRLVLAQTPSIVSIVLATTVIIYTFRKPHPLVGHGIARGALGLTRLHVVLFSNSGWLVAKRHSSGACEFACSIFYAQCLFLG